MEHDHGQRRDAELRPPGRRTVTRVAHNLIEWGDSALPEAVLLHALRGNDPYKYEQPFDLDAYAAKYIGAAESVTFSEADLAPVET